MRSNIRKITPNPPLLGRAHSYFSLPANKSAAAEELEAAWVVGWGSGALLPKASTGFFQEAAIKGERI